jgi:hypothetical protein
MRITFASAPLFQTRHSQQTLVTLSLALLDCKLPSSIMVCLVLVSNQVKLSITTWSRILLSSTRSLRALQVFNSTHIEGRNYHITSPFNVHFRHANIISLECAPTSSPLHTACILQAGTRLIPFPQTSLPPGRPLFHTRTSSGSATSSPTFSRATRSQPTVCLPAKDES